MCTCASLYQFYSSKMTSNSAKCVFQYTTKRHWTAAEGNRILGTWQNEMNDTWMAIYYSLETQHSKKKEKTFAILFKFFSFPRNRLQLSWSFVGNFFFAANFSPPSSHPSTHREQSPTTNVNMANFCAIFCSFFFIIHERRRPVFVAIVKLPRMLRDS